MSNLYVKIKKILDDKFKNGYSYFIYTKNQNPLLGNKSLESQISEENIKTKIFSEHEFIEGRIFNKNYELRIFYDGSEFKTILVNKDKFKDYSIIKRKYLVNKSLKSYFKYIEILEYLEKDEDGEYWVKLKCLDELIGE